MTILTDQQIIQRVIDGDMIAPFSREQIKERDGQKLISSGLSSAGYDLTLDSEILFPAPHIGLIDPKRINEACYVQTWTAGQVVIPPGVTVLGTSVEYLRIPEDVHCLVVGKSTYARVGIHVLTTPAEPGWSGKLTIEISNLNPLPAAIYTGEGICQIMFFRLDAKPITTYKDRNGKYNGQTKTTIAKV